MPRFIVTVKPIDEHEIPQGFGGMCQAIAYGCLFIFVGVLLVKMMLLDM